MVKKNDITSILRSKSINNSDVRNIKELVKKYPFFSTAQLLLTKCLHELKHNDYDKQLKKTASYVQNRKKFYELIMQDSVIFYQKDKEKSIIASKNSKFQKEENKKYSFSEWLKISQIDQPKENRSADIINNFIQSKPKIQINKDANGSLDTNSQESLNNNKEIITLTLAKVYAKQGHYEKAIEAYEELILKYPKKNSFFASQIKLINKLKEE